MDPETLAILRERHAKHRAVEAEKTAKAEAEKLAAEKDD